jgi:hypothetical protein
LPAEAFIAGFLQHILPKGFVKVRYYGLFRVGQRQKLARLRAQLVLQQRKAELLSPPDEPPLAVATLRTVCPRCGQQMRLERILPAQRAPPAGTFTA